MRSRTFVLALFAAGAFAQTKQPANYDESKVGAYTLPDALDEKGLAENRELQQ